MQAILVPESFQRNLDAIYSSTTHALLLAGKQGVQLREIAAISAKNAKCITLQPTDSKGVLDPAGSIRVDAVEMLYEKTRGKDTIKTVVVIIDIDRMTRTAQNKLLKLLEEPSESTRFIATTHQPQLLLKTITSRMQLVHVPSCTNEQSRAILEGHRLSDAEINQLLFIASGRPAYLKELATTPKMRSQAIAGAKDARQFLSGTLYERTVVARQYSATRDSALQLLTTALTILSFMLQRKASPQLLKQQGDILLAYENIVKNGSPKIHLLRTVI